MIYGLLILASFVWGINVLVMKMVLSDVSGLFLAFLKVFLSCISLYFILKAKKIKDIKINYKESSIIALFSLTINFILTFFAMKQVSGANNAIMNALAPAITMLLSFMFFHKSLKKREIVSLILSMIGFFVSIQFQLNQLTQNHLILIIAMASYCFANLMMQQKQTENHLVYTFGYLFMGTLQLLLLTVLFDPLAFLDVKDVSWMLWILFILFSGVGFAFIQVVYLMAIQRIGSIKTSFFLGLNPMFTLLGSFLFLKEKMEWYLIIAYLFLLFALYWANRKEM